MKRTLLLFCALPALAVILCNCKPTNLAIGGVVYHDANENGVFDTNSEGGIADVLIRTGNVETRSADNGGFLIVGGVYNAGTIRVEFIKEGFATTVCSIPVVYIDDRPYAVESATTEEKLTNLLVAMTN